MTQHGGRGRDRLLQAGASAVGHADGEPCPEFKSLIGHLRPDLARQIGDGDEMVVAEASRRTVAPVYLRRNQ